MAAAVLLRSVARKMSRAADPTHYHPSLVARGLHGGARSGPADSNQIQQGAAMAAATGLRSVSGLLTTKMAHAPPTPYHVHGRGIHSRTSPDPVPSTPRKVLDTTTIGKAFDKAADAMAYIALASAAIYMHFWIKPKMDEVAADYEDLRKRCEDDYEDLRKRCEDVRKRTSHLNIQQDETLTVPASAGPGNKTQKVMHSQENGVKLLEATIMNLEAEISELKDSARSNGKG